MKATATKTTARTQSYDDYLDLLEYAGAHLRNARDCSDATKSRQAHDALTCAISRLFQARELLEAHENVGWSEDDV